jgi:hypothetical protein
MRSKIAIAAAAVAAPLILTAAGAFTGGPQFQTPTTDRAQETRSLLVRAARAINAEAPRTGKEHISNLWVYPTADDDMVFAQYVVTTNDGTAASSQPHLELLQIKGERIVRERDLTRAAAVTD